MVSTAWSGAHDADLVCVLLDAKAGIDEEADARIRAAVEALGGKLEHVIRTRMFVTDVSKWEEVAKVHGEVFAEIRPATSILEVARLIDKDAKIEIEADAIQHQAQ